MKTRRNMKNGLVRKNNSKGLCFVAVAVCCMLVCTSGMAAVTGVSKSQNVAVSKNAVNERVVSPRDIGLVKYHYGCDPSVSEFEQYDINKDGVIDPEDVAYIERHGLREPLQVPQLDKRVQHVDADFVAAEFERTAADPLNPDVVYVDDDFDPSTPGWGVDHFDSIQDGIDAVAEDGQVLVSSGIYGSVSISKSLQLLGEDEESTIIQGDIWIRTYSGSIDNVIVSRFTITYCTQYGVIEPDGLDFTAACLENAYYCTISNCTIQCGSLFDTGIVLEASSHNLIKDCDISGGNYAHIGIKFNEGGPSNNECSNYNTVINNRIYDWGFGIFAHGHYGSDGHIGNIIKDNLIESNGHGIELARASYNEICYNILWYTGNPAVRIWNYSGTPSYGNKVHHNNFILYSFPLDDSGNNWWYDQESLEGNYWDYYWGEDVDGDRIGDEPYPIVDEDGHITTWDLYPLMFPWGELPPVAQQFTYVMLDGLTVQFDASDSFDRDGDIVTYSWDFDDDTTAEVETPVMEHTFPISGYYNVTLTVIDNDDYSESIYKNILIDNSPPTPYKPTGCTFGFIDETYTYWTPEVTDPDGDTVEYLFDWGDDTDSGWLPDRIANHSWSAKGIYEVRVKARDQYLLESGWSEPLIATIHDDLCPCDVNDDGMVDPVDVGLVKYYYGQDPSIPAYAVYDVNLDGSIDPVDVGLVKYYYGPCPRCG